MDRRRFRVSVLLALAGACLLPAAACRPAEERVPDDLVAVAEDFLNLYNSMYRAVYRPYAEAQWRASTDVTPEHDGERVGAGKVYAAVVGNEAVLRKVRHLLERRELLQPLQVRQLEAILLDASESPGTIPEVVGRRIEAESRQSSTLDSFQFCLRPVGESCREPITPNRIDDLLEESRDLAERLRVWEASKGVGPTLKAGLEELRDLRNAVAREMGYSSFFALQVADYGMTVPEMMDLLESFLKDSEDLYRELHCWTKHALAQRYGRPVPERVPAQWLGNRWAQSWPGIVEGIDLEPHFRPLSPEAIVQQAERFYVSMGFPALPAVFWERSDLYPPAEGSGRLKNTHASAWDIDLVGDVRSLMSVQSNRRWFGTAHHELGHIYYYLSYDRPGVPMVLRRGANRAFHEGVGELIALASMQLPYLRETGILPAGTQVDPTRWLLDEALEETVPFLPWSAGVMSHWERDLYEAELPADQFNARWWEYVRRFQGIDPPGPRGEEFCDACTKTHVNDDAAQYYDYAIATVLKYQLHDHICGRILKQDVHACNYHGRAEAGEFLRSLLEPGRTRDWRELLREATGSDLSTRPLAAYFQPLVEFLRAENQGRSCGWGGGEGS